LLLPAVTASIRATGTVFQNRPEWKWDYREHAPKSTSTAYAEPFAHLYDAVLLYDMPQTINAAEQRNFLELFGRGVGVVALHHALCSYQDWDLYAEIIGVRLRASDFTYLHEVDFGLQRVEVNHSVLDGVTAFQVHDETYGRMVYMGGNQPLMVTSHPTSMPVVVWTRQYKSSRVVMIQPGHGPQVFKEANFQRLLGNAVRWAARRS